MKIPAATYRLQFNSQFGLSDAARIVKYLHELGITDIYASPLMKARAGSVHGYDVTDPNHINPEIGTEWDFEQLSDRIHQTGMGILVDIVPNHMSASLENPWWVDILAHGERSTYANLFDIDWTAHKVFLPILDKPYGECLEAGDISLQRNNGQSSLKVLSQELPVHLAPGARADTVDDLDRIISAQPYRIGYWRKAADAINYRRFFDINDLVAIRAERDDAFYATHSAILNFVAQGLIDGLRIDHIDGLLDPKGYLERLPEVYVVVEKILGGNEQVPDDWKTHGTTGYDFLNIVNAVFIDPKGFDEQKRFYSEFTGIIAERREIFRAKKRKVMTDLFSGDLRHLTTGLIQLAQWHRDARDLTRFEIQEGLAEVTAALPVYRTYIRNFTISETDRSYLEYALQGACTEGRNLCPTLQFIREVLLLQVPYYLRNRQSDYLDWVMKWQQFTGPVMAKGLEDTTFYFHNPLISTNEVGSDCAGPEGLFGIDRFHQLNMERLRHPYTLNTTSTHDTKRGEDSRVRIDVLSEITEEWERCVRQWSQWNYSDIAPDANEQIFIYQTLLGAWPVSRSRLHTYLVKALREAKTHTDWLRPDEHYERRVLGFVDRILDPSRSTRFLADFLALETKVAFFGALNSLSQALLKISSPGVPDFYQGTELWDLSLADPDNRHPVDYAIRMAWLEWLRAYADPGELLNNWQDGRIKMFLIWKALNFRGENRDLFVNGDYIPISTRGSQAENVVAFARRNNQRWAVVAVARLASQLTHVGQPPIGAGVWADTIVELPPDCPNTLRDVFTGRSIDSPAVATIFSDLPFALLENVQ